MSNVYFEQNAQPVRHTEDKLFLNLFKQQKKTDTKSLTSVTIIYL